MTYLQQRKERPVTKLTAAKAYMLLPSHLRSADIATETGEVRDINRWFAELINRIADEKDAEIEQLQAELAIANSDVSHWAKHARDIQAELAALRVQQQPAPAPQEPAESALDKAGREACERYCGSKISPCEWGRGVWGQSREAWRRVVAPFVKDEPPEPVKTDGELLRQANREEPIGDAMTFHSRLAATFLRLRAERDGTTTDNRKAV